MIMIVQITDITMERGILQSNNPCVSFLLQADEGKGREERLEINPQAKPKLEGPICLVNIKFLDFHGEWGLIKGELRSFEE